MRDFTFHSPGSLDEVKEALRDADEGKLLAGGHSLLPVMKLEMAAPSDLVSLRDVPGLDGIEEGDGEIVVGAACTHAEVAASEVVRATIPALADLAGRIGDPQVRNRGTLGGSVAHADPAADYPAALVALDAVVVTDSREIPAEEFFQGMFQTPLEEDEIVTAVRFRVPEKAAYAKFPNPASRYALAGIMVARVGGEVRVGVTGASHGPFRATGIEEALAEDFDVGVIDAAEIDESRILDDDEASAEYRVHLIRVLAQRAVGACG